MKKEFYSLPDAECERMTRAEMNAVQGVLAAVHFVANGRPDLQKRLAMIPNGKRRYNLMLGQVNAIANDLVGITKVGQCKQIRNIMHDCDLRFTPKMTPMDRRVVIDIDDVAYLIDAAKREQCTVCTKTDAECRSCGLYQVLERVVPLDDYKDGTMCPYMLEGWADR